MEGGRLKGWFSSFRFPIEMAEVFYKEACLR